MMPTQKRHPSAYLLEIAHHKILLDIGHTTIARLIEMGIDLYSIDTIFVSHFHTDHFGDFLPFIHSCFVEDLHHPAKKHQKPLLVLGPKTFQKRWDKLREVFWVEPENYPLRFIEGSQTITLDSLKITLFPIVHVPWFESVGIKIQDHGKTFVYTGDIGGKHPMDELQETVRDADLLLIESSYLASTPNHFSPDQIIELSQVAHVKKTVATHLRDEYIPALKQKFKNHPTIVLAKDKMRIEL